MSGNFVLAQNLLAAPASPTSVISSDAPSNVPKYLAVVLTCLVVAAFLRRLNDRSINPMTGGSRISIYYTAGEYAFLGAAIATIGLTPLVSSFARLLTGWATTIQNEVVRYGVQFTLATIALVLTVVAFIIYHKTEKALAKWAGPIFLVVAVNTSPGVAGAVAWFISNPVTTIEGWLVNLPGLLLNLQFSVGNGHW